MSLKEIALHLSTMIDLRSLYIYMRERKLAVVFISISHEASRTWILTHIM